MCGIFGVVGRHEVAQTIRSGLQRLEYRGYDSAGIATLSNGTILRRRAVGKLANLTAELERSPLPGAIGIGHTRWATHGAPTLENAHPHVGAGVSPHVTVVHNGIIENHKTIRDLLTSEGVVFTSQTDTEVIAHLAERYLRMGMLPDEAARKTVGDLHGAYALCLMFRDCEDRLFIARRGAPLAIGHGEGETFIGSDAVALAPVTTDITYLEEGDFAVVAREGAFISDANGQQVHRPRKHIAHAATAADRGG